MVSKIIKAFRVAVENNEIVRYAKRVVLSAAGYKEAVDEILSNYPNENIVIVKYKKDDRKILAAKMIKEKIKVKLRDSPEKKVLGEPHICIRSDGTVWNIKVVKGSYVLDRKPVVEYVFGNAKERKKPREHIFKDDKWIANPDYDKESDIYQPLKAFYFDNNQKCWIEK